MMPDTHRVNSYLTGIQDTLVEFLCDLIQFKSTRGNEKEAVVFLREKFAALSGSAELIPIPDHLIDDPDYSFYQEGLTYGDRPNLLIHLKGSGEGKSLIINTHVDVVPAPEGWDSIFTPEIRDCLVYGRGACDCKGQITMLYGLLMLIREFNIDLKGDIYFHMVIEEEVGGNGTLHMINSQPPADGVLILEPSSLDIHPSVRGAVWFEISCEGRAGHSGSEKKPVSAVKVGIDVIGILEKYHAELLARSKGVKYFERYENPMPLTFGMFHGGNWPSSVPQEAVIKGILGFLPNLGRQTVKDEIVDRIRRDGGEWIRGHVRVRFPMLNNDAYTIPDNHPLFRKFLDACRVNSHEPAVRGMTASCDAWMYGRKLGIPTIVFGAGDLGSAHSVTEHVAINDINKGAAILLSFVDAWCGSLE